MTKEEFDRKLLPLAREISDTACVHRVVDSQQRRNKIVDEIAMMIQHEYGPPLDSDTVLDVQFLEALGWLYCEEDESGNAAFWRLDIEENRRLVATKLHNSVCLEALDRMTFEWNHLCDFKSCETRGDLRRLHELLGVKSDVG